MPPTSSTLYTDPKACGLGGALSSGVASLTAPDETVDALLNAVAHLYAYSTTPDEDLIPFAAGDQSALAELATKVGPDTARVVSVALSDVLFECRAALEYAESDSAAHRLAHRIVEAMRPLSPAPDEGP